MKQFVMLTCALVKIRLSVPTKHDLNYGIGLQKNTPNSREAMYERMLPSSLDDKSSSRLATNIVDI
ncbi:hypothetical protein RHMOL_Rhmol06G0191100 [Rhododendron molle]|uniref:Uncharacterized protein n=1 Tax=Rhododendron molle TaxID=49168 RepID=A0ACC0NF61_RHOML|nr:hypothetical protein RHMOL_Rhmol06G0191100 [Rhododendron molle]